MLLIYSPTYDGRDILCIRSTPGMSGELYEGVKQSRDSVEASVGTIVGGMNYVGESLSYMNAIKQGAGGASELQSSAAGLAEAQQALGKIVALLATFPTGMSSYLTDIGFSGLAPIGIPPLAEIPVQDPGQYTLEAPIIMVRDGKKESAQQISGGSKKAPEDTPDEERVPQPELETPATKDDKPDDSPRPAEPATPARGVTEQPEKQSDLEPSTTPTPAAPPDPSAPVESADAGDTTPATPNANTVADPPKPEDATTNPAMQPRAESTPVETARVAPTVGEAKDDASRDNVIGERTVDRETGETRDVTEQEALQELETFLDKYIAEGQDDELLQEAASIKASLNFMGEQEVDAACGITAEDWNQYLTENPEAQILVVPGVSQRQGQIKSDTLVTEKILEKLDPNGDAFTGRVVGSIHDVTAGPDNVRVIIVDDWSVSGQQISATASQFAIDNEGSPYVSRMEVNLLIASPEMQAEGFRPLTDDDDPDGTPYPFEQPLPVKASLSAKERLYPDAADVLSTTIHVTGSHSGTDFGFGVPLSDMRDELQDQLEERGEGWREVVAPILVGKRMSPRHERAFPRTKALFSRDG
jgi:hypothetical protein